MENHILFISAFKDIDRSNWQHYKRSTKLYISYFMNIAKNIKYKP